MKRTVVNNTAIKAFFVKCQKAISYWNANRHDGGGEIKASLELVNSRTDELVIRLDAEPHGVGVAGRMTMLQIWFDSKKSMIMRKTPLLPTDNTKEMTLEVLQCVLDTFDP